MVVMMVSPAREGSIHVEDGHPLSSSLNPAVGWVFPREIHHILPLERPECWVTCDSIGLFLETECRFPLESEDDYCCYHEGHEFLPGYRGQGCGLTNLFVKKASVELVGLYRRFTAPWGGPGSSLPALIHIWAAFVFVSSSPLVLGPIDPGLLPDLASPKLKLVCSPENRDRWIVHLHFNAFLERLYHD
ncbi:hypothetical protein BDM02DRAFT_3128710 [Thelephora ganbajun]|uniref:Uncharacterized protein n=1 Tax=Thelephora ganbajun TaxID=370292 RepID=A0ACB6ZHN5_THEGA|nr:hypothetical protein BDM02DRAFT_3128710 [Thelephora ganbajun]